MLHTLESPRFPQCSVTNWTCSRSLVDTAFGVGIGIIGIDEVALKAFWATDIGNGILLYVKFVEDCADILGE